MLDFEYVERMVCHSRSSWKRIPRVGVTPVSRKRRHGVVRHAQSSVEPRVDKSCLPGIRHDASELVGSTPLVRLSRRFLLSEDVPGGLPSIALKMEMMEPCGSVKDRIGLEMVRAAEEADCISPGVTTLVEATSGNTGVGLAFIAAAKGYKLVRMRLLSTRTCAFLRHVLELLSRQEVCMCERPPLYVFRMLPRTLLQEYGGNRNANLL